MTFTPITWTDGTTPVNASNMNRLETALSSATDEINSYTYQYFNSLSAAIEYANSLKQYEMRLVYFSNNLMNSLGLGSSVSKGFITKARTESDSFDFVMFPPSASFYSGRYLDGELTAYRFAGTQV